MASSAGCLGHNGGLKIGNHEAFDESVQGHFYIGWQRDHYITSVLCFAHNGTIPAAFYNVPECLHDSTMADQENVYHKLEMVYNETSLIC